MKKLLSLIMVVVTVTTVAFATTKATTANTATAGGTITSSTTEPWGWLISSDTNPNWTNNYTFAPANLKRNESVTYHIFIKTTQSTPAILPNGLFPNCNTPSGISHDNPANPELYYFNGIQAYVNGPACYPFFNLSAQINDPNAIAKNFNVKIEFDPPNGHMMPYNDSILALSQIQTPGVPGFGANGKNIGLPGGFNDSIGAEYTITITNIGDVDGTLDYNFVITSII